MLFIATTIAPGTTKTTMLLNIDLNVSPINGINERFTIPANINATEANKNGCVSFAVKLNKPTMNPKNTKVVIKARESIVFENHGKPANIAIIKPMKKQ